MFLSMVATEKKLPFELEIPSDELMELMKESERGDVEYFGSVEDLIADLEKC